ncbi:MAG: aminotransferase class III-fold pyridoxal phosphate-dependent enzyme, partial [Atribacterota bacterium]
MLSNSKNKKCKKIVEENNEVVASFSRIPYYPLVVKRAYKSTVEDMDGNKFIDFLSSAGALNVGHCHPNVVQSIIKQTQQFILYTPVYM